MSASLELEKFFKSKNIKYYCCPYIDFTDVPGDEFKWEIVKFTGFPGWLYLNKIANSRWLVQYYGDEFDLSLLKEVIDLLESVIVTNGYQRS